MKDYLGDGVYAEYNEGYFQIILTATSETGRNVIYLEGEVFENLLRFFERFSKKKVTITEDKETT